MNAHRRTGGHGPDVVAPPPLLFLGPLLAGLLLDRLLPPPKLPRTARALGVPLLAAGLGLGGWFFQTMRHAGTPLDPGQAPTALVESGPFALTRNPGYLAMTLVSGGLSLLLGARWPLLLLPGTLLVVDQGVIEREEAYLQEHFGDRYGSYRSRVPRWL
ncbi:MAG: methyltransferase family protein [Candidatus Dormibacteraceae bacterium]